MVRRRRKKKYSTTIKIVLIVTAIVAVCVFYSDIMDLFRPVLQKVEKYSNIKRDLKDYTVFGIDVSEYQTDIDWKKLCENDRPDFVIIRACAGKNKLDKKFLTNWKSAKEIGIIRGAYHYYRPDEKSTEQAEFFIKNVQLEAGDLPPVLDIEKFSRVQSLNSLKSGLLNWLKIVEEHYGITPILYTYNKFYTAAIADDPRFAKYPVWIAWYTTRGDPSKITEDWVFWQYTDKGSLSGIKGNVDVNVFNGKIQDLDGLRKKE
ncbi:MAG TPA: glycoside hydrolase family 25 protein [Bacteroidales bacterium]|nr:glycoside hydrolase family 25 protein [Bacteroidales bacterium]